MSSSVFDLPARLAAKAIPALVAADEEHFASIAGGLERSIAELNRRLDAERRAPGGEGQQALERDQRIHGLTARLRTLQRYGVDLCLGRMVPAGDGPVVYVGRLGLSDDAGRRLLIDWRSPAAAPFFGATHAKPMGLHSLRRYRWHDRRITDYWDEVFDADSGATDAAPDYQSAFIASLGGSRSSRMRDVLGTIQADQDAIIRAGSSGPLVVDGGPGTGKTVVALHRAAYLLYADPRLRGNRGGVLFVGPSRPYLDYVADVLPGLGEDGVRTCTLRDLLPEGAGAHDEADPQVSRLKASLDVTAVIEAAVGLYEEPPPVDTTVETPWSEVTLTADDWAEVFAAPDPGTPHNDARDQVWDELAGIVVDKHDDETDPELLRASLRQNRQLQRVFTAAWPLLDAADVVGDLWSVPAYLRRCAPTIDAPDISRLQRADAQRWTVPDLPLLDAARRRLGDPEVSRRRRRQAAEVASQRTRMGQVIDDLIATDDSELLVMTSLRHDDLRDALVDESGLDTPPPDALAGPFAHVVVDEAQELTDAEWQMVLSRCPSRSVTIVGDRAQARHGFGEPWADRLDRVGLDGSTLAALTINYRTPSEVMAVAEPVIRAALPDANVPTSIRDSGVPVRFGDPGELDEIVTSWLAAHGDGTACVIGDDDFEPMTRVRSLTPELAKGLEFDLVVLVRPDDLGDDVAGAVDRYVAMTRTTRELVVLRDSWGPAVSSG